MKLHRKTTAHSLIGGAIIGAIVSSSAPAMAEKNQIAETLFDKGIELMQQDKFDRACPHLEESYRRDPLLGALIALADCEYERGRLATALKRYQEYVERHTNLVDAGQKKQGSRILEAKARIDELQSSVPTIKIAVPADAKVPILRIDGIRVTPDVAHMVDPGKVEVSLDVHGRATSTVKVEMRKSQKKIMAMDLGKPLPPAVSVRRGGGMNMTDELNRIRNRDWAVGVTLMSIGMLGYLGIYFVAASGEGVGGAVCLGVAGAMTFGGGYLASRDPSVPALRRVSVLPMVTMGRGQSRERPIFVGVQGVF